MAGLPVPAILGMLSLAVGVMGPATLDGANAAGNEVPGPVEAAVLRVLDGDTLEVRARIWLGQEVQVLVRLAGIDAPELKGDCPGEMELAIAARRELARAVTGGPVSLSHIRYDKYGGRVVARVATAGGKDAGEALVAAGLARVYAYGPRRSWCVAPSAGG